MKRIFKFIGLYKIKKPFYFISFFLILLAGILGFVYNVKNYPKIFSNDFYAEKTTEIAPKENVVIDFSQPILLTKQLEKLEISPVQKVRLNWENNNKKLVIFPEDPWTPETEYIINFPEIESIMFTKIPGKEIKFSTIEYPKITQFSPKKGSEDVTLDIEDPLIVKFNEAPKDFDIKFLINSSDKVSFISNEEYNSFSFLPDNIEEEQSYMTQVLVKHKDESENRFKNIYASSFKTAAPSASKAGKDFGVILQDARKNTKAKIKEGKYIDLSLANQVLSTFENGKLLDSYIVSTGKRGMETPKGEFKVMAKKLRPWSNKYKLYMPFFMQFTGQGHGIHELPEWPGGYKEGANHLGFPVSHGCVRLGVGPAEQVYNWAEAGTPIVVY